MMRIITKELENRTIAIKQLLDYGFKEKNKSYTYERILSNEEYKVVFQYENNKLTSRTIDLTTNEDYILTDIDKDIGSYTTKLKEEINEILKDIINNCSKVEIFQSKQAKEVIMYIKNTYEDELEFLWEKFPKNAVVRHKDNQKWYVALLTISKRKLGINSDEEIDIIDLRYPKKFIHNIIDNKQIFPGYHMNKNNWITIPLNKTLPTKEIIKYIDISYKLK